MAIFGINHSSDITQPTVSSKDVNKIDTPDSTNIEYLSETPLSTIVKQIGGYKWYVDYYNALTTPSDFDSTYDATVESSIVEYNLVVNMLIYLDNPLDAGNYHNLTGGGYIHSIITPRVADIIVGKLMDGRLGVFVLTGANVVNYSLKKMYHIEFKLDRIIDDPNDLYLKNIKDRTVGTFYFNKESLTKEDQPLISKAVKETRIEIDSMIEDLLYRFNNVCISYTNKNLPVINTSLGTIYDPYLEKFLLSLVDRSKLNGRLEIIGLPVIDLSILDAIISDVNLSLIKYYTNIRPSTAYGYNVFAYSYGWAGINNVLELKTTKSNIKSIIYKGDDVLPTIDINYHIFSKEFYGVLLDNSVSNLTTIENIVLATINRNSINFDDIVTVYDKLLTINDKTALYYFIPITIYILMRYKNYLITEGV